MAWWLLGAGEGLDKEFIFNGYTGSAGDDRKVLEVDGGAGCTTR